MKKFFVLAMLAGVAVPAASAQQADPPRVQQGRVITLSSRSAQDPAEEGNAGAAAPVQKAVSVRVDGNRLIITGPDGQTQTVDIGDAKGLSIVNSTVVENRDGQEVRKSVGKAIVIGPDGQKMEIQLDGVDDLHALPQGLVRPFRGMIDWRGQIPAPEIPRALQAVEAFGNSDVLTAIPAAKYFIGVHCQPANDTLRAQLGLEEGAGIVVQEVTADSPAAAAGLQPHDILLFADDTRLGEVADLVKVVQHAGEEGSKMSLTLLRKGAEVRVEIQPAERDLQIVEGMPLADQEEGNPAVFEGLNGRLQELRGIGPALLMGMDDQAQLLDGQALEELQKVREQVAEDMRRAQEEIRAQMQELRKQLEESREQMKQQLEEFRKAREQWQQQKPGSDGSL